MQSMIWKKNMFWRLGILWSIETFQLKKTSYLKKKTDGGMEYNIKYYEPKKGEKFFLSLILN